MERSFHNFFVHSRWFPAVLTFPTALHWPCIVTARSKNTVSPVVSIVFRNVSMNDSVMMNP